jgi:transcriptional regulator GlxA family with amidase domain
MEQKIEEPLSTRALADAIGISPRQMERLFVREFGSSPSRFYLELRLRHAQRLLLQSTDSVLDIALKCGFANASHFGKHYREVFSRTPAAFRRGHRGGG